MSQTSRFTRARQLTSRVLPGRRLDGYADQVTGRLRRIAAARSTGMLPFSRVSAVQWALLIRVRHGSTPRDLAWDLSRSVFGTTIEAYRLLARQLLSVAGPRPDGPEARPVNLALARHNLKRIENDLSI